MTEPDRYLPMNRTELIAECERLRAKLEQLAKQCVECGGTGIVQVKRVWFWKDEPCGNCADIHQVLDIKGDDA